MLRRRGRDVVIRFGKKPKKPKKLGPRRPDSIGGTWMPAHDIVIAFGVTPGDAQTKHPMAVNATWASRVPITHGVADPQQLPLATGQAPDTTTYDGWGVGAKSAGWSYSDPTTSVTVYKVTDSSTPTTGKGKFVPDYSEGGPYISLPWTSGGKTYYTLKVHTDGGVGYLGDFNYTDGTFGNWRYVNWNAIHMGFSFNAATPQIAYYISSGTVRRHDTSTDTDANTGNFPSPTVGTGWMHFDENDTWFTAIDSGVVKTWNSQTDAVITWPAGSWGSHDEPHLDRGGAYVYAMNEAWEVAQGKLADGTPWEGEIAADWDASYAQTHPAPCSAGYMVGHRSATGFSYWDPVNHTWTKSNESDVGRGHNAGQWVIDNDSGLNQWFVASTYLGGTSDLQKAIGFRRINFSEIRLLCHTYTTADGYWEQPHGTISPDGKLVMWGSDMNNSSGRQDTFLAIVPTS